MAGVWRKLIVWGIGIVSAAALAAAPALWVALEKDGLHDPANPAIKLLQQPAEALAPLPRDTAGNQVRWVQALDSGAIAPRTNLLPETKVRVLDQDIIVSKFGSMPAVKFPHRQHTLWLDCSNCHPAIFIPQKGANQISMASILLGQKCGVCHGKVAFPVSECRLCHSQKKDLSATTRGASVKTGEAR